MSLVSMLRRLTPIWVLRLYHHGIALLGAIIYWFPSRQLIVVGVTGTNGKSTTVNYIAKVLAQSGDKAGFVTTANIYDGQREWMNKWKLTMPGRFHLQKLLRQMVTNGCRYAVVEISSEGLIQYRHAGINFDVAVFTNLTPEHIERHGGFENYKRAKGMLFRHLTQQPHKSFGDKKQPKVIVVNADDQHAEYFLSFVADKKIEYGLNPVETRLASSKLTTQIAATNVSIESWTSSFVVDGQRFEVKIGGQFNVYNALAAVAIGRALGLGLGQCAAGVASLTSVPGRMERIEVGQPFIALVDYAPEPESMRQLQQAIGRIPHRRIIHVFGSAGGGRDVSRRPILGKMVASYADVALVTNEDPYDEDPQQIINQIVAGVHEAVGTSGRASELIVEPDRRQAIRRAVSLAKEGDLVVVTGKASEQWLCWENGRKEPWDDRQVLREELERGQNVGNIGTSEHQ
jgi:UDP-N-acetylmuramoyl-L-alanyl-D-glutamate--2,6-diaminopimelate ligase